MDEIIYNSKRMGLGSCACCFTLTPEQIEEQKKIEARKDRLHQNYLKRKENGKQKE